MSQSIVPKSIVPQSIGHRARLGSRLAVAASAVAFAGLAGPTVPSPSLADASAATLAARAPRGARPSIHQQQLREWKQREARGWEPWRDPQSLPRARDVRSAPSVTREVHGYHPYWMGSSYLSFDWSLLTTVAFFSLELNGAGDIVDDHGWPWTTLVSRAHANGVRVIVTATLFSSTEIDQLLASPANRSHAIGHILDEVVAGSADGVNVDFEGVPGARKQDLVTFLGELSDSLASVLPDPYLSIATPAVDWNNAFDYDELAARADHLMVMAYDYHWLGSSTTGPVAPLVGWGTYNVGWTVNDYQTWGALPQNLLLGVPYYGYRWPASSGSPGAATTADGSAVVYDATATEASLHGGLWDEASSTPWYRFQNPGWFQGWHDDEASLGAKYDVVNAEDLAGIGIWALGYDGARPELWNAIDGAFGSGTPVPDVVLAPEVGLRFRVTGANPFRDATSLGFRLEARSEVQVSVHDVTGRRVLVLAPPAVRSAGSHRLDWDGRDTSGEEVPAGVYFVRLLADDVARTVKVTRAP